MYHVYSGQHMYVAKVYERLAFIASHTAHSAIINLHSRSHAHVMSNLVCTHAGAG